MIFSISELKSRRIVTNIIGPFPTKAPRPALVVWARKEPKDSFLAFISLSRALSNEPLGVFVDDLCSQIITKRTLSEQQSMNERYSDFFVSRGCALTFSSEIYSAKFSTGIFSSLVRLGRQIPVNEFKRCLPEPKRRNFSTLTLGETIHLLLELLLLEQVKKKYNLLLVGHFSQAIVVCHRKTSPAPLSALAIPKLNSKEEIDAYVQKLLIS